MALSDFPRTRSTETLEQQRTRENAARVEAARRDLVRVAELTANARPLAPITEDMGDLEMLEVATALSTAKT
ncbi:hypothetical protein MKL09_27910 [Methylobacterium sp. J-048]|uniref:hypothetical protein n=1 Tax=Methylobacterium sp. J-048 TaxID=2836635 RepID=UPI001FBA71F3|nr:hypothetical protein [Methylobacterium sp. J-048]MCJ2060337.1 hypothetical protein [Methylobacterium sp. J-048]